MALKDTLKNVKADQEAAKKKAEEVAKKKAAEEKKEAEEKKKKEAAEKKKKEEPKEKKKKEEVAKKATPSITSGGQDAKVPLPKVAPVAPPPPVVTPTPAQTTTAATKVELPSETPVAPTPTLASTMATPSPKKEEVTTPSPAPVVNPYEAATAPAITEQSKYTPATATKLADVSPVTPLAPTSLSAPDTKVTTPASSMGAIPAAASVPTSNATPSENTNPQQTVNNPPSNTAQAPNATVTQVQQPDNTGKGVPQNLSTQQAPNLATAMTQSSVPQPGPDAGVASPQIKDTPPPKAPTPAPTLRATMHGGQLIETSAQEISRMAQGAGMDVRPTSAISTLGIGGNQDQAKMAMTPQNKGAAIAEATAGGLQAQGTPPPKPRTYEQYKEEQANQAYNPANDAQQRAQLIERMGSLGSRVQIFMENKIKEEAARASKAGTDLAGGLISTNNPAQDAALTAFQNVSKDPNATTAQKNGAVAALVASGVITQAEAATPDVVNTKVASHYKDAAQSFVDQLSPDKIKLDNNLMKALGVTKEEVASLGLGVDATLADIQNAVRDQKSAEFSRVSSLQAKLNDPFTSPAERQEIQKQLSALSKANVTGAEQTAGSAAMKVDEAGKVSLFGKDFNSLEDALSSNVIQDQINAYLQMSPEKRKAFASKQPELAAWMNAAETELRAELKDRGKVFNTTAESEVNRTATIKNLGEDLAKQIFGNDVSAFGTQVDWSKYPGMELFKSMEDSAAASSMVTAMRDLAKYDPNLAKEMLSLSPEDLRDVLTSDKGFSGKDYTDTKKTLTDLAATTPTNAGAVSYEKLLDTLFGTDVVAKDVISNYSRLASTGMKPGVNPAFDALAQLDTNRDGKIGLGDDIKGALSNLNTRYTLKAAMGLDPSGPKPFDPTSLKEMMTYKTDAGIKQEKEAQEKKVNDAYNFAFNRNGVSQNNLNTLNSYIEKINSGKLLTKHELSWMNSTMAKLPTSIKNSELSGYMDSYGLDPEQAKAFADQYNNQMKIYTDGLKKANTQTDKATKGNAPAPVTPAGSSAVDVGKVPVSKVPKAKPKKKTKQIKVTTVGFN